MTFPIIPASTVSGGYQISRSLRFRSSASAYLSRTPGSAANRQQYTISFWFKRGLLNTLMNICSTNGNGFAVQFSSSTATAADTLRVWEFASGAYIYHYITTPVYRDPSAWYHCVIAVDGTTTTFTNSVKIYINGTQVTAFSTQVNPTATFSSDWNNNVAQNIGRNLNATNNYFDGYLAEFYNVPGQLTPTDFGAYDTNGVWQPKAFTGTYGTNGFYLNFSDNSGATATTIGKDSSGNSNNWTPNNISVTSGTTYDSMIDSPTNYADGGNGRGNYAVLNPLMTATNSTVSDGNLATAATAGAAYKTTTASLGVSSGKWYWECYISACGGNRATYVGVIKDPTAPLTTFPGNTASSYGYDPFQGLKFNNGTGTAYGSTFTTGDTISVALDLDNGKLWWAKNGAWQASGDPAAGTNAAYTSVSGTFFPIVSLFDNADKVIANFGQRPFAYTPPSGFSALNTQNLPTPTIANGAQYMAAVTYTGDSTYPRTITNGSNNNAGTTFQPDLVWVKSRSAAYSNILYDVVRGTGTGASLVSDTTQAEGANSLNANLSAFTASGFTIGSTSSTNVLNVSGQTFVGWQWKAGGTGVTNTSGSITSTVSANTSAGFSVVTYTGNSAASATIGHGLGVTLGMLIIKHRDVGGDTWGVWHSSFVTASNTDYLLLTTTGAKGSAGSVNLWNSTAPNSTVFSIGNQATTNINAGLYVAYCFAPVAGYSAFGSYTGNGSADGPFVYTGFRPRWIMIKSSTAAEAWYIIDTSRDTYNAALSILAPNLSSAEFNNGSTWADVISNGFKIRYNSGPFNTSSATYIYAAFAENPFRIARAR